MTSQLTAGELLTRIEKMKPLYYKGFVNILQGIFADAWCYTHYPEERSIWKPHALEMYSAIDTFYREIPFDDLTEEEFQPLFQVRELMPYLGEYFRRIFDNPKPKERDLLRLGAVARRIGNVSYSYRTTFFSYIDQYRQISGNKEFVCIVTDRHGRVWKL